MKRFVIALSALAMVSGGAAVPEAPAAQTSWCGTYCDAVHLGCLKTIAWFDEEACWEWYEGCLDGCRVGQ